MTDSPTDTPDDPFARLVPDALAAFYDALSPPHRAAVALLALLNRAADPSFKSRYARRWWGLLEERAKLGAMISSGLTRWTATVTARLGGTAGRSAEDRQIIQAVLVHWEGADAAVLDALQHDTPVLMAFVRALSDHARAAFEARTPPTVPRNRYWTPEDAPEDASSATPDPDLFATTPTTEDLP